MGNTCKSSTSNCHLPLFFYLLIFMLAGAWPLVSWAQAQQSPSPCENVVAEAQKLYDNGHFAPAISLLQLCLPDGVPEEQRGGAYRLLAHAFLAEDKPEEAKEAIAKIFSQKRDYACDPAQDSQPYCDLVKEVEPPETMGQKLFGGWKKWVWVAGAVGITAGAIALIPPPNDEQPLPEPPGLP
jgi:hypothetical protein